MRSYNSCTCEATIAIGSRTQTPPLRRLRVQPMRPSTPQLRCATPAKFIVAPCLAPRKHGTSQMLCEGCNAPASHSGRGTLAARGNIEACKSIKQTKDRCRLYRKRCRDPERVVAQQIAPGENAAQCLPVCPHSCFSMLAFV